jgi:hypothetical protein
MAYTKEDNKSYKGRGGKIVLKVIMDKTDILERTIGANTLASDINYYRYIFKKTEKIVCAVFYILRSQTESIRHDDVIVKDLEDTAQRTLSVALHSLSTPLERKGEGAQKLGYALMELESKLRILSAAQMLSLELLNVFVSEMDSVVRSLRNYSGSSGDNPLFLAETTPARAREHGHRLPQSLREGVRGAQRAVGHKGEPSLHTRTDRVIAVLKDKGQATIKDVSDVVTDCSEKTLQRELNGLIIGGVVKREGERRWSKYSLV